MLTALKTLFVTCFFVCLAIFAMAWGVSIPDSWQIPATVGFFTAFAGYVASAIAVAVFYPDESS